MTTLVSWAGQLARALLREPVRRRWAHVQGVAARARSLAHVLGADADLVEAGWLHDSGYAPGLAVTGLHALDGARYLRDVGTPTPCCAGWSPLTPAPSSRPGNAGLPMS